MDSNKRRFFVTGRTENRMRVFAAIQALLSAGDTECVHDWTDAGETKASYSDLTRACYMRIRQLPRTDLFLALLPGGRGTHADLGLAMGSIEVSSMDDVESRTYALPVFILHSETPELDFRPQEETQFLYYHPLAIRVSGSFDALLSFLNKPDLYKRIQAEAARYGAHSWVTLPENQMVAVDADKPFATLGEVAKEREIYTPKGKQILVKPEKPADMIHEKIDLSDSDFSKQTDIPKQTESSKTPKVARMTDDSKLPETVILNESPVSLEEALSVTTPNMEPKISGSVKGKAKSSKNPEGPKLIVKEEPVDSAQAVREITKQNISDPLATKIAKDAKEEIDG